MGNKMKSISTLRFSALVAGLWFMMTRDAGAYIDPGTTSYLFQIVIAGLTAVVFFFAGLRRRVVELFRKIFKGDEARSDAEMNDNKPPAPNCNFGVHRPSLRPRPARTTTSFSGRKIIFQRLRK